MGPRKNSSEILEPSPDVGRSSREDVDIATGQDFLAQFGLVGDYQLEDQRGERSIPFQPHLVVTDRQEPSSMAQVVDEVVARWTAGYIRTPLKKREQFRLNVELVLRNLLWAEADSPGQVVGIGKSKQRIDESRRYNPDFMTVSHFLQALHHLQEAGLVDMVSKGYRYDGLAKVSRFALSAAGKSRLDASQYSPDFFATVDPPETILLKDTNKYLTKYQDNGETNRMRAALERINHVLAEADIGAVRDLDTSRDVEEDSLVLGKRLYRVFNNSSFQEGGRFYGGWWEVAKRHFRPLITINGEPTVEADFRGLHPAMLFAKAGLPIPEDPYAMVPGVDGDQGLRDHTKRTFMALLNATSGQTREPRNFDEAKYGMTAAEFRQAVQAAFPMFAHAFGTGQGTYLQREDSDLAEAVILHFVDQGVPVLPVHDSFIIAEGHRDELVVVMQAIFHKKYRQEIRVAVKGNSHLGP